ncbi:DUF427 domain protein [Tuber magnatum]|uniref:DUF427 domain protein n=1 Tax=Tuber magnatum TaxID=42249 RepID=A0A317SFK8_9PEZI|nr:DUF427 domain protein [Tuber magnatum]
MLPTATVKVNGTVIARSDTYETVEGNIYVSSDTSSHCPSKGTAVYYNVKVDGVTIKDAAWCYPDPEDKFRPNKDFVAFCMYAPLMLHLKRVPFRLR